MRQHHDMTLCNGEFEVVSAAELARPYSLDFTLSICASNPVETKIILFLFCLKVASSSFHANREARIMDRKSLIDQHT